MKRMRIDEPDRLDRFMKSFSQGHSQDFKAVALKLVASGQSIEHVAVSMGVGIGNSHIRVFFHAKD